MATAGQGDLLAGVLGAYLALGMDVEDAAILASSLCAMAAERLGQEGELQGVLAHEVASELPRLIKSLRASSIS
jgi:NAD(P)H-hydrate repair Nnr-like enzyme with NAD(P)H-hydrate dehydratase domain